MLLGAIADDFTGASDLANTLAKGGMSTVQFSGIGHEAADDDASVARLLAGICKLDLPPEAWPQRAPADDEASSIQ